MSSDKHESIHPLGRRIEKQHARDIDQFCIERGIMSRQEIAIKNDFFRAIDWRLFRISAIGNRVPHPRAKRSRYRNAGGFGALFAGPKPRRLRRRDLT